MKREVGRQRGDVGDSTALYLQSPVVLHICFDTSEPSITEPSWVSAAHTHTPTQKKKSSSNCVPCLVKFFWINSKVHFTFSQLHLIHAVYFLQWNSKNPKKTEVFFGAFWTLEVAVGGEYGISFPYNKSIWINTCVITDLKKSLLLFHMQHVTIVSPDEWNCLKYKKNLYSCKKYETLWQYSLF